MIEPEDFAVIAARIAQALGITTDLAAALLAVIGDTPAVTEDRLFAVATVHGQTYQVPLSIL